MTRPSILDLARYAELAYEDLATVQAALPEATVTLIDRDDTQVYIIETADYTVVDFRGTQVTSGFSMTDILRNAEVRLVPAPIGGRVHRGYKEGVDLVAEDLAALLPHAKRPHYFVGHSLGGAEATYARTLPPRPDLTVTFGAPKVGDKTFVRIAEAIPLVRYTHGKDIAPKHARPWLGYRHGGQFRHISHRGKVTQRRWGWRDELLIPFSRGVIVGTFDHRVGEYVQKLRGAEI